MKSEETRQIKELLEQNLALTTEIQAQVKKINKFILLTKIMGAIKIIIIVAPLVFALIYLPPLIKDLVSKYQEVLSGGTTANSLNINSLIKNLPLGIGR